MDFSRTPAVTETVLAEWTDAEGCKCTLGSLTPYHKGDAGFLMKATVDQENRVWVRFSLSVNVKTAGKERSRELTLLIPPQSLSNHPPGVAYECLPISRIQTPAIYSAAGDTRLFESGRVIRADFTLSKPGHTLMPRSSAKRIIPASTTTSDLLRGLRSLSKVCSFSVYIKPSDYARQGLKVIRDTVCNAPPPESPLILADMLYHRTAQVDWGLFGLDAEPVAKPVAPPPYALSPLPAPLPGCEIVVPATPTCNEPAHSPSDAGISLVPETDVEGNADNIEKERDVRKRKLSLSAKDSAREPLCQFNNTHDNLLSNLAGWIEAAMTINGHVYDHPHLQAHLDSCAKHAASSDPAAFFDARAALAAEFFYDPDGVAATDEEGELKALYVADMARFLRWALRKRGEADLEQFETLLRLGRLAREAAARREPPKGYAGGRTGMTMAGMRGDAYTFEKSVCVGCLLHACAGGGGRE